MLVINNIKIDQIELLLDGQLIFGQSVLNIAMLIS